MFQDMRTDAALEDVDRHKSQKWQCFRMGELESLERLLQAGADPDPRDQRGSTALMFSVMYDMKKVTKLLLKYGADINLRSAQGETPLIMAISMGRLTRPT